jgi:carbamoyltransferase
MPAAPIDPIDANRYLFPHSPFAVERQRWREHCRRSRHWDIAECIDIGCAAGRARDRRQWSVAGMRILSTVCETHDTGAALVEDGAIVSVLEEERHSRIKHTLEFPSLTLRLLAGDDGRGLADIDMITVPWDPRRVRRTFAHVVARRFPLALSLVVPGANTMQETGIAILEYWLRSGLKQTFPGRKLPPICYVGHHESHAAMFFVSPFEDATVIVMDGYGDDAAASVFTGEGHRLQRHWRGRFLDSLGIIYTGPSPFPGRFSDQAVDGTR